MPNNYLETNRLILKLPSLDDYKELWALRTDSEVMKYIPGGTQTKEQVREHIDLAGPYFSKYSMCFYCVFEKNTGKFVGQAGLFHLGYNLEKDDIELAYRLHKKFWGMGYATELANMLIDFGFNNLKLHKIMALVCPDNIRSKRVLEKIGMNCCGFVDFKGDKLLRYEVTNRNIRKVEIIPYDSKWPTFFKQEANILAQTLASHVKEIHHFGSTSIPNMPAKPVIDILLECDNLDQIDIIKTKLTNLNYTEFSRHIIPHWSYFTRKTDHNISFHLHIRELGDPQIKRHIWFRDYLIAHPELAKQYAELKLQLASKFEYDIYSYVYGKDKFIQQIDAKAKLWSHRRKNFYSANFGSNITTWPQDKIIKAIEANFNVDVTYYPQYMNEVELLRYVDKDGGYTRINSNLVDDTFNIILEADFKEDKALTKITEVIKPFIDNNIPFSWWVCPLDKPDNLGKYLEQAGLHNLETNVGMYLDLDSWHRDSGSTLKIIKAENKQVFADFAKVAYVNDLLTTEHYFTNIANVYSHEDPIECYVGYINNEPVVSGRICFFAQVAGLYMIATAKNQRKKGYGTAMLEFLLERAQSLEYHVAVLQASPDGLSLYKRQGFISCCEIREYKKI